MFCYKTGGGDQKLAQRVYNQLSKLPFSKRGTKTANFYVLRQFNGTNTDACLVEYGFIDSEEDDILANMDKASEFIAKGLLEHLGIKFIDNNNNQGDDFEMEHAVFFFTERDASLARMVSSRLGNCAMYCRDGNNSNIHSDIKFIKHPVIIGGAEYNDNPNTTNLCGYNDFDTAYLVAKYVRTL